LTDWVLIFISRAGPEAFQHAGFVSVVVFTVCLCVTAYFLVGHNGLVPAVSEERLHIALVNTHCKFSARSMDSSDDDLGEAGIASPAHSSDDDLGPQGIVAALDAKEEVGGQDYTSQERIS
jgi:hypothetical protein